MLIPISSVWSPVVAGVAPNVIGWWVVQPCYMSIYIFPLLPFERGKWNTSCNPISLGLHPLPLDIETRNMFN
jgi:hypothetical protein